MKSKASIQRMSRHSRLRSCVAVRVKGSKAFRILLAVACMLFTSQAWANYSCSKTSAASIDIPISTTVMVPRNAAVGSFLTSWANIAGITGLYSCATKVNGDVMGLHMVGVSLVDSKVRAGASGEYIVWKTNVAGVGVAIRTWTHFQVGAAAGSCTTSWQGPVSLGSSAGNWSGNDRACGGGNPFSASFGEGSEVALVKTGDVTAGSISRVQLYAARMYGTGDEWYGKGGYDRKYFLPKIAITVGSCATPDVSVELGKYPTSQFANVGSRSPAVKFTMQVNSCPAGLAKVSYGFNFSGKSGYTPKQGLFGLTDSSTAKGIRVKLMNDAGTETVELDKWYTLSSYKTTTGGNYTVPLSAAYERTGTVTEGSANAELIIAMYYE